MEGLLGLLGPQGAALARHFQFIGIAQEEMQRAGSPQGAFAMLYPSPGMSRAVPDVFRAHCRELLARKSDHDLATDAELLLAMSGMSLRAPINELGKAVYGELARRVLPHAAADTLGNGWPKGPYPGAVEEHLSDMRRKLRVHGRRPEPPTPSPTQPCA